MKKFVQKSFTFITTLLISSLLIQQLVFLIFRKINVGELGVINKIMQGEINSEILICGSSRSFVGIDPQTISKITGLKTFNISLNGSRLGIQLPVLKSYLEHNKKPKILLQEVGFESLTPTQHIFAPYKYLPYLHENELYQGLLKIDPDLWIQKYIPLSNFIYFNTDFQKLFIEDLFLTGKNENDYLKNGYEPHSNAWTINEEKFIGQPQNIYFYQSALDKDILLEIIELCKELNIKLVLITTPVYKKIERIKTNSKIMIETYSRIANQYNVSYFNYFNLPMSEEKEYFYNFTHLAKNGAKEFSKILSQDLIKNNTYQIPFEKVLSKPYVNKILNLKYYEVIHQFDK